MDKDLKDFYKEDGLYLDAALEGERPVWDKAEGLLEFPTPEWTFEVGGGDFWFQSEKAPNWFHRWAQRLVFGFKWERIKKDG